MTATTSPARPAMSEYCACDTEELNSLLRGELSAIESYQQAIPRFQDWTTTGELSRILEEHAYSASVLQARVINYGGTPATNSGLWGTFSSLVAGTAKILGPQTILAALREGEEIGTASYERALENPDVNIECKYIIRGELIRRCQDHVATLNRLMDDASRSQAGS